MNVRCLPRLSLFCLTAVGGLLLGTSAARAIDPPGELPIPNLTPEPYYEVSYRAVGDTAWSQYASVATRELAIQHRNFLWYHKYDVKVQRKGTATPEAPHYYIHKIYYAIYYHQVGVNQWSHYATVADRETAIQHRNFLRHHNYVVHVATRKASAS